MQESSTSRRVDFDIDSEDDDVTIEHLKRTHPLRSSFLHGDPDNKATRSSTRSHTETIRKSSSRKNTPPGQCPVHGKKVTVIGSVPDVVIPVPISRQISLVESIVGVQPVPLKSALKGHNETGVEKRQGWAGLQWALLVGCYALMLLLAVVVGVVLIHQHRINNSADSQPGSFPTQLTERTSSDLTQGSKRGPGPGVNNKPTQVSPNLIRESKSASDGNPSRTSRGRPKSLSSQELSGNTFRSKTTPRQPRVHQAGFPVNPIQQSSQPSLTGHPSRQPHLQGNQRFHSSSSNNQDRGSSASRLPTRHSSFPGNQTRGSSLTRQQINQQTFSQQNNQNRGSSPPRSPIRPSSFPGDQTRSSSFPTSSHQAPNQRPSPNQQRNQPSFPNQRSNQPRQPVPNTRRPSSRQQQPHLQASHLPSNTNQAIQPHFQFEQNKQPVSPDGGNPRLPGNKDQDAKIANLWNHQNSDGSFTYGYVNTDGSFKNETRSLGGCVKGIYGYVDPVTNQQIRVPYQTGNTPGNSCNTPQPAWTGQSR